MAFDNRHWSSQQCANIECFLFLGRILHEVTLTDSIRYANGDPVEEWLCNLLCLNVETVPPLLSGCPVPASCDLYYVNRDTLFSYHKASEAFLQRLMSLYVTSHYKVWCECGFPLQGMMWMWLPITRYDVNVASHYKVWCVCGFSLPWLQGMICVWLPITRYDLCVASHYKVWSVCGFPLQGMVCMWLRVYVASSYKVWCECGFPLQGMMWMWLPITMITRYDLYVASHYKVWEYQW